MKILSRLILISLLLLLAIPAFARTVISPTTSAAVVGLSVSKTSLGTSVQISGDLGSDIITIEISDGAGGYQTFTINSVDQTLTANNMSVTFYGALQGRINKPSTTNSVGVDIID